jgi:hypothetical protein
MKVVWQDRPVEEPNPRQFPCMVVDLAGARLLRVAVDDRG